MKLISIPGIHSDGTGTTDKLGYRLEALGYDFLDLDLPRRNAFNARWKAKKDAKRIIEVSEPGDVLIAHSFGCLRSAYAMREIDYLAVFMFRPAMRRNWKFPEGNTGIRCIYSRQDYAILAGSALLFHPFGMAGFKGFKNPTKLKRNTLGKGDHNNDFSDRHIDRWASYSDFTIQILRS